MKIGVIQRIINRLREMSREELDGLAGEFLPLSYHTSGILRLIFWRRLIPQVGAIIAILLSGAVLVGWGWHIEILKSLLPGGVTMKANAAIGFGLTGLALLILQRDYPRRWLFRLAQGCAIGAGAIGFITLVEYIFGIHGGIDQLFFTETLHTLGTFAPGRMSLNSAVGLFMAGAALMTLSREKAFGWIHFLSIITGFIGLVAFTGYVYQVPLFYSFADLTQMALPSAFILMFIGVGILFARPDRGFASIITSDSAGGNMARHLLPAAVFIPLLLGLLRIAVHHSPWYDPAIELSLQSILSISIFAGLIWGNARSLHQIDYRRKTAEETMRHQALHDPLTGLPNRKAIRERFGHFKSEALKHQTQIAFIFIDLDRFKTINDTLGHYVGDEILKEVAARFSSVLRTDDMICRLGGDEFLVVAPGIHKVDEIKHVAEKLLAALGRPLMIQGHTLHVGTSMGIGIFPQDGTDIHTLLQHSDTALYRAKENGRSRYQFYDYSMNVASYAKLSLENDMRSALENNQFILYYQPIVDMSERLIGVEALLRWNHPKLGILEPIEFISLAEETGLIIGIGEWVIRTAALAHQRWISQQLVSGRINVNFSSRQFAEFDLAEHLQQIQSETGISLNNLEFEITESVAMENTERTSSKIKDLRAMDIALSIDDFGTGYSSLSYLKRFPVKHLKIDKSFIAHCTNDEYDASIVRAIIAMAHSLGISVIAEGVESSEQREFLHELNCDGIQGFLIGRPMPEELFSAYLERRAAK